jgi:hypothetical protein
MSEEGYEELQRRLRREGVTDIEIRASMGKMADGTFAAVRELQVPGERSFTIGNWDQLRETMRAIKADQTVSQRKHEQSKPKPKGLKEVRSLRLTKEDRRGKTTDIIVHWLPKKVEGVDLAADNVGRSPVIWFDDDDCPVRLREDGMNSLKMEAVKRQVVGTTALIEEAEQVESKDGLEPGCFCVEVLRDEGFVIASGA